MSQKSCCSSQKKRPQKETELVAIGFSKEAKTAHLNKLCKFMTTKNWFSERLSRIVSTLPHSEITVVLSVLPVSIGPVAKRPNRGVFGSVLLPLLSFLYSSVCQRRFSSPACGKTVHVIIFDTYEAFNHSNRIYFRRSSRGWGTYRAGLGMTRE